MAALHEALSGLSPVSFDEVPHGKSNLREYLLDVFSKGQLLIDSVPPPPPDSSSSTSRLRSGTATSIASNVSEMSSSSARAEPLVPAHGLLQKDWGKPIKLSAKENPMGIGVYKMSGKDGRAWFARRSVHEGMPFSYWKKALQREFPETLEVQGAPGEGNIRGIGAERKIERKVVSGVGCMEVYHLSAQFPGPTTPRDFVTLLLTSSAALSKPALDDTSSESGVNANLASASDVPRHFMVMSRPCQHPDCPPRSGFIRGEYESIEFIREVPLKPRKSSSTTDLTRMNRSTSGAATTNKQAVLRHAHQKSGTLLNHSGGSETHLHDTTTDSFSLSSTDHAEGRVRGKTISFAESRGITAKGEALDKGTDGVCDEEEEANPVEWIMITRSNPGGSVPRFMVERGTPSSIVADASKFLDWACKKGYLGVAEDIPTNSAETTSEDGEKIDSEPQSNCQTQGLDGTADSILPAPELQSASIFSAVANAAYAGLETCAPQSIVDRLPLHHQAPSTPSPIVNSQSALSPNATNSTDSDSSSTISAESFASADSHLSIPSLKSTAGPTLSTIAKTEPQLSSVDKEDRELVKLASRKAKLDEKLHQARVKELKDKEVLTSKEAARVRKAEEKHAIDVKKAEERFEKEMKALEARRRKEEEKERKRKEAEEEKERKRKEVEEEKERKRKEGESRDREKKDKEALMEEIKGLKKERDLQEQRLGELQRENTALVAGLGKLEGGDAILRVLKIDDGTGQSPRSSTKGSLGESLMGSLKKT